MTQDRSRNKKHSNASKSTSMSKSIIIRKRRLAARGKVVEQRTPHRCFNFAAIVRLLFVFSAVARGFLYVYAETHGMLYGWHDGKDDTNMMAIDLPMPTVTGSVKEHPPKYAVATKREDLRCTWAPENDDECVHHLAERIRQTTRTGKDGNITWQNAGSRWIFSGDSTISVMYRLKIHDILHGPPPCPNYSCRRLEAPRGVGVWKVFGLPVPEVWQEPNFSQGEGPCHRALEDKSVQDCRTCDWDVNLCIPDAQSTAPTCNHTKGTSGGYVGVEFARDVEVQSTLHPTSQENFAQWLNDQWNTPALVQALDRPICVLAAGLHDQSVPNITATIYTKNIKDYLSLMAPQCSHIIWLSNNAPKTNDMPQTKEQTLAWNEIVLDVLYEQVPHSSFVDVFEASKRAPHQDNIHMRKRWYLSLGGMFRKVIQTMPGQAKTGDDVSLVVKGATK